jgi:hypothetical protein
VFKASGACRTFRIENGCSVDDLGKADHDLAALGPQRHAGTRMMTHRLKLAAAASAIAVLTIGTVAADKVAGTTPADEAMTCEQIAAELMPYAQQMMGSLGPMMQTQQEVLSRAQQRQAEAAPKVAAMSAAAAASTADPTGATSKAVGQAQAAVQAEEFHRAMVEDKPLNDKYARQSQQVLGDAQRLKSNERVERLMQLAQQKHCR